MAKIKKADLDTLITKISGVLNRDVYILNYTYCIGGYETNSEKVGDIILELDSDYINLLKELYPNNRCIYFKAIKKSKADLDVNLVLNIDKKTIDELEEKIKYFYSLIDDNSNWNKFIVEEEYYESFFDRKEKVPVFKNIKDIPNLEANIRLFPKLTEKNINDFYFKYYYKKTDEDDINYVEIVTRLYCEIFCEYINFSYIDLEEKVDTDRE